MVFLQLGRGGNLWFGARVGARAPICLGASSRLVRPFAVRTAVSGVAKAPELPQRAEIGSSSGRRLLPHSDGASAPGADGHTQRSSPSTPREGRGPRGLLPRFRSARLVLTTPSPSECGSRVAAGKRKLGKLPKNGHSRTSEEVALATTSPVVQRWELSSRLRELRHRAGLTIEQVAQALMRSTAQVSRMETGQRTVQLRDIRDLAALYHLPAQERDLLADLARGARQKA